MKEEVVAGDSDGNEGERAAVAGAWLEVEALVDVRGITLSVSWPSKISDRTCDSDEVASDV